MCEFVWAYLEGTKTQPEYKNLTWEKEGEILGSQEENLENEIPSEEVPAEVVDQTGAQTED